jgi:D-alanyl-D-alanine carboxypeptidase
MPRRTPWVGAVVVISAVALSQPPTQLPVVDTTAFSRDDTGRAVATPTGPVTVIRPIGPRLQREARVSRSGASRSAGLPARPSEPAPAPTPAWARACTDDDGAALSHANGQVPDGELCNLPIAGHRLHSDAARAWGRLNQAYQDKFSAPLCLTDSYRSLSAQQSLYSLKPGLAATAGTSNHGWGVAVDLCGGVETGTSAAYRWLSERGRENGWVNPGWAQPTGSRPEPWHWEYIG